MRRRPSHVIVKSHHPRLRRFAFVAAGIAVVILGWLLFEYGRSTAGFSIVEAKQRQGALTDRIADLESENTRLKSQVALLGQAAEIDRRAYEEVEVTLTDLQNELLELRQEVAFYRGIVNSEDVAPGLRIQSFKLRPGDAAQYQFRLVLTQLASARNRTQGQAQISLTGMLNGTEIELPASKLLLDTGDSGVAFNFRNFQELRGVLSLPEGFMPLRVNLRAVPKQGDAVERTFNWAEVLS
jgi:hypothetical protein